MPYYIQPSEIGKLQISATVEYVPKQIFTMFPNLHTFQMLRTNLSELNPGDFTRATSLRTIDFRSNNLRVIKSNVFAPFQTVSDPTSNTEDTVNPLRRLLKLVLHQNNISEIEANAFNGLTDLFHLHMPHNSLGVIRRRTFVGMPSLRSLPDVALQQNWNYRRRRIWFAGIDKYGSWIESTESTIG